MNKAGIRHSFWYLIALCGALLVPALASGSAGSSDQVLAPDSRHEKVGELVTQFVQKSHYNHLAVDDDLSSRVLDRYIESLDRNRVYLLDSDVRFFEQYRYELDDLVSSRNNSLDPVFEMFDLYRSRVRERLTRALVLLETEPDFGVVEEYQFDRSETPWAKSDDELDEIWRKRVKNDALNLVLADKTWEEAREILEKRYARYLKRMEQVKSDDVFETFMTALAHTLDPHSSYLSPRNADEYRIQMSLSYFGIGASLQTEDDFVMIVNIIPGGPAAIDGKLKPNDKITGVAQGLSLIHISEPTRPPL